MMKYKMSQFSFRLRKYKHCENIRNHKIHERLLQYYKILTFVFLCKGADKFLWNTKISSTKQSHKI